MENKEINQMIAEKIMGWNKQTLPNTVGGTSTAEYWVDDQGKERRPVNFFKPSTNLEDAWWVVENSNFELKNLAWQEEEKQWRFTFGDGCLGSWSAYSEKVQLAICLSALKSVNIEN
jgi:hypothetical protein